MLFFLSALALKKYSIYVKLNRRGGFYVKVQTSNA